MKRNFTKAIALVVLTIITLQSYGQAKKGLEYSGFWDSYYFKGPMSISLGLGTTFYNGDLATPLNGNNTLGPAFQLAISYKPFPKLQIGFLYNQMSMAATDSQNLANPISFETNTFEIGIFGKFYIVDDIVRKHSEFLSKKLKVVKPYATVGLGAMSGTGTLNTNEITVSSVVIPIGIGVQFDITRRVGLYVDINYKYSSNDNLEGFESGAAKDSYITTMAGVQYSPSARRMKAKKFKAPKSVRGMVITLDTTKRTTPVAKPQQNETSDEYEDYSEDNYDNTIDEDNGLETEESEYEDSPSEEDNDDGYYYEEDDESEEDSDHEEEWDNSSDDEWDTSSDDGW
jgi:hypothetical protein